MKEKRKKGKVIDLRRFIEPEIEQRLKDNVEAAQLSDLQEKNEAGES